MPPAGQAPAGAADTPGTVPADDQAAAEPDAAPAPDSAVVR
jgi:hypothetical protein